jgi:DnaJ family protein C protein 28
MGEGEKKYQRPSIRDWMTDGENLSRRRWDTLIDMKIREGIANGEFNDLPGKGQPINLDENPHEDPTLRTAHRLLRNNGFTLPWIDARKELEQAVDAVRAELAALWSERQRTLEAGQPSRQHEESWERALDEFRSKVAELNRKITFYNIGTPSAVFHRPLLNADLEIEKVTRGAPPSGK